MQPSEILDVVETKSSSSKNVYTTILFKNCIACTCPAGGQKKFCKHMVNIVHKNLELIKETNQKFYDDLIRLIEVKFDSNHSSEELDELSCKLIYRDKGIVQQAFNNSKTFKEKKNRKNDLAEVTAKDISSINIYHQFEFFNLICKAYNDSDIGFRYCEYPQSLDEFIKRNYLITVETPNGIKNFRKMDKGRKSIYFYKISPEIKPIIRQLHKKLAVKFPKVQIFTDERGLFFIEKRIIDPKYL